MPALCAGLVYAGGTGGPWRGKRSRTSEPPRRSFPDPSCPTPWVSDGTRTRDVLDHNQVLYQLSYTHHAKGPNMFSWTTLPQREVYRAVVWRA